MWKHSLQIRFANKWFFKLGKRRLSQRSFSPLWLPAPCDPTNVAATLNCLSDVVTVTWRASAGANYYTILAEASGHVDSCNSTGTSCELTKMQCGNDYTVTVLAGDTKCNSSIFAKTNITTGTFIFGTKNDVRINWVAQIILMQKKNEILNFLKLPTIIDYLTRKIPLISTSVMCFVCSSLCSSNPRPLTEL